MPNSTSKIFSTTISRRYFLGGMLAGGGSMALGMYLWPETETELQENAAEATPRLDVYPVTLYTDCYRLFMNIGQTLLPRIRQLPIYQQHERDIFKVVYEQGFFVYANDYVVRIQKHYAESTIIIAREPKVGEIYLAESIRLYPQGWGQIIYTMLVHTAEVLVDYISKENS